MLSIRPLEESDLVAAHKASRVAFGGNRANTPSMEELAKNYPQPGVTAWGGFDSTGRLIATTQDRVQEQWFGGRAVPTSGFASVTVFPESRRQGVAEQVLTRVLAAARERGAAISTLYRAVSGVYRRLGWEDTGTTTWTSFPSLALGRVRAPNDVRVRAADESDVPAILSTYQAFARSGNGYMDRVGPLFETDPAKVAASFDGITLAEGPDGIEGYASWRRGPGHGPGALLHVDDLIAMTSRATAALLSNIGNWGDAVPTVQLRTPADDLVSWQLPTDGVRQSTHTWMLRIIDADAAIAARGWSPVVSGVVDLEIVDERCPWNAGRRRLRLDAGSGVLSAGGVGAVQLTMRGLALWFAGGTTIAALRQAGLVAGDSTHDALLDAAALGPRPALLDFF